MVDRLDEVEKSTKELNGKFCTLLNVEKSRDERVTHKLDKIVGAVVVEYKKTIQFPIGTLD